MPVLESNAAVHDHKLKTRTMVFDIAVGNGQNDGAELADLTMAIATATTATIDLTALGDIEKVYAVSSHSPTFSGADTPTGVTYASAVASGVGTITLTITGGTTPDLAADAGVADSIEVIYKLK